jgi:hypothetical protein
MGGLIMLMVAFIWLGIVVLIARFIATYIRNLNLQLLVQGLIIVVLTPLPLVDEILGKREFEQLCLENKTISVDKVTAVGRVVYLDFKHENIKSKWLKIRLVNWRYLDATTNELVLGYKEFEAERTWLRGNAGTPFLFKGVCSGEDKFSHKEQLFKELKINEI